MKKQTKATVMFLVIIGAGIVTGEEVSDNTSGEISGEIGYTEINYPIDDIPTIIVPPSHRENLKNFQILNLRYENGKIKFCIKDSTTAHRGGDGPKISLTINRYSIQKFPIDIARDKMVCHETNYIITDYAVITEPAYLCVNIIG